MKRSLVLLSLILLTACAAPSVPPTPTNSPIPNTTTHAPTPVPTETMLPSPTPTPLPYYLEEGILYDLDELSGEYVEIADGIEALATTAEGVILAEDGGGSPRFYFKEGAWKEIQIPEGTENYEEKELEDRYVTIVNDEGKTEEVLESGTKVLVNPETGIYEYEFKNGVWVEYTPRVMVVGEGKTPVGFIGVPREVIETAAETVQKAEMFKRIINGEVVELKTGLDELWGEAKDSKGTIYAQWYGILCGVVEIAGLPDYLFALLGVEMKSGDILLVNMLFYKARMEYSSASLVIDGGIMPNRAESELDTMKEMGRPISRKQITSAILKSPTGTPFYIVSHMTGKFIDEGITLLDALKTREFLGSAGESTFQDDLIGASDIFWDLAESQ